METWYILEDGGFADPNEVSHGDDGVLRHVSGTPVAYGPHGPRSRGMSPEEVATYRTREMLPESPAAPAVVSGEPQPDAARETSPEKPKRQYRTRGLKAD